MYLLDTNIFVYYMKNSYPNMTARLFSMNPDKLFISALTVCELEYGAEKSNWGARTRDKLYTILAPFQILNFTSRDAIASGRIRGMLEKKGTPIGTYDTLIAGQALSRGLILVTHNTREFKRVENLIVEDWTL